MYWPPVSRNALSQRSQGSSNTCIRTEIPFRVSLHKARCWVIKALPACKSKHGAQLVRRDCAIVKAERTPPARLAELPRDDNIDCLEREASEWVVYSTPLRAVEGPVVMVGVWLRAIGR